jgi:hypothetical protein
MRADGQSDHRLIAKGLLQVFKERRRQGPCQMQHPAQPGENRLPGKVGVSMSRWMAAYTAGMSLLEANPQYELAQL